MLNRVRAGLYKQPFTLTFTPTVMLVDRGRTRKNQREPTQTRRKHASATLVESPTFFLRNGAFSCHFSTLVITFNHCGTETAEVFRESAPTFADVLVLQPQLPLDLFVRVPDGARLLETIHRLLYKVVPEVPQNGDKVAPLSRPVQRMNS